MRNLSLLPDPWNKWAYEYSNPELYNSEEAKNLRECRDAALRSCPEYMFQIALRNDEDRRKDNI